MKRIFISILLLLVFSAISAAQNQKLPDECRKILDKNFRGWKFTEIRPEIKKFLRKNEMPHSDGNIVFGDFNGDRKRDYAVLIDHGNEILNDGTKLSRNVSIAFVRRGKGYKYFVLDTFGDYISLDKKGKKAYDYETQSGIKFSNDAVFVGIWEKAGRSFVWRKDKFIYFATSD